MWLPVSVIRQYRPFLSADIWISCPPNSTDETFKASAYLFEALTDPAFSKFDDPSHTPLNKAFNSSLPLFEWLEQPGNEDRLLRFGIAFESGTHLLPPKAILDGTVLHLSYVNAG